jgi:hypothetical protein
MCEPTGLVQARRRLTRDKRLSACYHIRDARLIDRLSTLAGIKGTRVEPVTPHGMRAGFVTHSLPQRGRGDHRAYAAPHPDYLAELRPPGQAQCGKSIREARSLMRSD